LFAHRKIKLFGTSYNVDCDSNMFEALENAVVTTVFLLCL
jgi:hypothetical protein